MKQIFLFFATALFACACAEAEAVKMPALFSDNMVLQQQSNVPLWGKSKPGAQVSVQPSWSAQPSVTVADAQGSWRVTLPTPEAGGPHTLNISGGGSKLTLNNVMVGEVWLCSGQSNMEMPLAGWGKVNNYEQEVAQAQYPNIRLLQVERTAGAQPQPDPKVQGGGWQVCSPATIAEFSATAYFFGRDLHKSLDNVPIGLINASWGGTVAEAWTSAGSLDSIPDFAQELAALKGQTNESLMEKYQKDSEEWLNLLASSDSGLHGNAPLWASADFDDSRWKSMPIPGFWERQGLENFDGIVWFRCSLDLPAEWQGKDLELNLAEIDDDDVTYFNGEQVGAINGHNVPRKYRVSGKLVKSGKNVVTVRVMDTGGDGGLYGNAAQMTLKPADAEDAPSVSLAQEWKYSAAVDLSSLPPRPQSPNNPNRPSVLFNTMINPFVPFTIRGAIWYQGEANVGRAQQYGELLPLLIRDWRRQWGSDFPFYYVQLTNFLGIPSEPPVSEWAALREAQLNTLRVSNTGMAVTIDIGEKRDIHPKNKQDVGARLALWAKANTYGQQVAYSGPLYSSCKVEGKKIRISFTHADGGLKTKNGDKLIGFTIAGADRKFYEATATIEGSEVVVSSPNVASPVAVRYAWADSPDGVNLYNAAELPASPFRTDF
ncbi:MAG: 9-O-acetylesterase [Prevotellaceae bacterium]|jgi:sialate O-acetylesterase|nr:9-O-acetylesterase [Prevotellaceae bacterium]